MKKEIIPVGGYVPLGGIRAYCVSYCDSYEFNREDACEACAFENTERCKALACRIEERSDWKNVFFTIKLNKK